MSEKFNHLYPTSEYIFENGKKGSGNGCDVNVGREQTEEDLIIEVRLFMDDILEK